MMAIRGLKVGDISFIILVGILPGPVALLSLRAEILLPISSADVGLRKSDFSLGNPRNVENDCLEEKV